MPWMRWNAGRRGAEAQRNACWAMVTQMAQMDADVQSLPLVENALDAMYEPMIELQRPSVHDMPKPVLRKAYATEENYREAYGEYLKALGIWARPWVLLIATYGSDGKRAFIEKRFTTYEEVWFWCSNHEYIGKAVVLSPEKGLYVAPEFGSDLSPMVPVTNEETER